MFNKRKAIEFKEFVHSIGYKMLGDYQGSHTKIHLMCDKGHTHDISPTNLKSGRRCHFCNKEKLKEYTTRSSKDAAIRFEKLVSDHGYIILDKYINTHTKVRIGCPCGKVWEIQPANFNSGCRCPFCTSRGYTQSEGGYVYLYEMTDEITGRKFLDYGITNRTPEERMKQKLTEKLSDGSLTKFKPTLLVSAHFNDGSIPKYIEDQITNNLDNWYTRKHNIPYTKKKETLECTTQNKIFVVSTITDYIPTPDTHDIKVEINVK